MRDILSLPDISRAFGAIGMARLIDRDFQGVDVC